MFNAFYGPSTTQGRLSTQRPEALTRVTNKRDQKVQLHARVVFECYTVSNFM